MRLQSCSVNVADSMESDGIHAHVVAAASDHVTPGRRIVMLCDWLPPDFGAVGQYTLARARQLAAAGHSVTLIGFTSGASSGEVEPRSAGALNILRLQRSPYEKNDFVARAWWTLKANVRLLSCALRYLLRADEVRFTGSPPYLIHFVMPLALLLRVRTVYRITDFHPECLTAASGRQGLAVRMLQRLTAFWRRRVDQIEVLGEDQARRLRDSRVDPRRVVLKRDPTPVTFDAAVTAASPPAALQGRRIVLYSGNWGVAHDHDTFVEGFALFCRKHPKVAGLWLNATGHRADLVEREMCRRDLPFARTQPVPLAQLPAVLLAADVHLITLTDAFVGYVLPSKVYACAESGRPILFVGSKLSDVDLVCRSTLRPEDYRQVDVSNASGVSAALEILLGIEIPVPARATTRRNDEVREAQVLEEYLQ